MNWHLRSCFQHGVAPQSHLTFLPPQAKTRRRCHHKRQTQTLSQRTTLHLPTLSSYRPAGAASQRAMTLRFRLAVDIDVGNKELTSHPHAELTSAATSAKARTVQNDRRACSASSSGVHSHRDKTKEHLSRHPTPLTSTTIMIVVNKFTSSKKNSSRCSQRDETIISCDRGLLHVPSGLTQ